MDKRKVCRPGIQVVNSFQQLFRLSEGLQKIRLQKDYFWNYPMLVDRLLQAYPHLKTINDYNIPINSENDLARARELDASRVICWLTGLKWQLKQGGSSIKIQQQLQNVEELPQFKNRSKALQIFQGLHEKALIFPSQVVQEVRIQIVRKFAIQIGQSLLSELQEYANCETCLDLQAQLAYRLGRPLTLSLLDERSYNMIRKVFNSQLRKCHQLKGTKNEISTQIYESRQEQASSDCLCSEMLLKNLNAKLQSLIKKRTFQRFKKIVKKINFLQLLSHILQKSRLTAISISFHNLKEVVQNKLIYIQRLYFFNWLKIIQRNKQLRKKAKHFSFLYKTIILFAFKKIKLLSRFNKLKLLPIREFDNQKLRYQFKTKRLIWSKRGMHGCCNGNFKI